MMNYVAAAAIVFPAPSVGFLTHAPCAGYSTPVCTGSYRDCTARERMKVLRQVVVLLAFVACASSIDGNRADANMPSSGGDVSSSTPAGLKVDAVVWVLVILF